MCFGFQIRQCRRQFESGLVTLKCPLLISGDSLRFLPAAVNLSLEQSTLDSLGHCDDGVGFDSLQFSNQPAALNVCACLIPEVVSGGCNGITVKESEPDL